MIADRPTVLGLRHVAAQTFGRDSFGAERCRGGSCLFQDRANRSQRRCQVLPSSRAVCNPRPRLAPVMNATSLFGAHLLELGFNHPTLSSRANVSIIQKFLMENRLRNFVPAARRDEISDVRRIVHVRLKTRFAPRNEVYESSHDAGAGNASICSFLAAAPDPQ